LTQSDTTVFYAVFPADVQAAISISENLTERKYPPGYHIENWSRFSIPVTLPLLSSSHRASPGDSAEKGVDIEYLCGSIGIQTLKALVMPENVHSEKALLKNGFVRESDTIQGQNWGGQESVALNVFTYNKADDDS
jgi:hypothetical protein